MLYLENKKYTETKQNTFLKLKYWYFYVLLMKFKKFSADVTTS